MADEKLVPFDPSTLADKVHDRIRASFVDLIPEDQWKAMVQREIDRILTPPKVNQWGGQDPNALSPLQQMIRKELEARFREAIAAELSTGDFFPQWDGHAKAQAGPAVREIIKETLPEIIAAAWGAVIQQAIEDLRSSMQRGMS